jgi:2-keto-3-deoxy-L-rhamnonate aldolase RhmA
MDRKTFKDILRNRKPAWGTYVLEHMTPHTIRTLKRAGFHWLWVENEHSPHSYETIQEVVRTADDVGIMSILRVTQGEYALIARALDMGVSGVIIPRVETVEQVRFYVDCAKYPPVGKRGFGIRASVFGATSISMRERIDDQNNYRFLFLQIESRLGVRNLDAMLTAARGQVDAVLIGPADFQMDIGTADNFDSPELLEAIETIPKVCAKHGVSSGYPVRNLEEAKLRMAQGWNLINIGSDDSFMAIGAEDAVAGLNALGGGQAGQVGRKNIDY